MLLRNTFLMKRLFLLTLIAGAIGLASPSLCPAQAKKEAKTFTEEDRTAILKMFKETHERFKKEIAGLSKEQLAFRPHDKSWTVAEVGEHIVITETAIRGLIDGGPLKSDWNDDPSVFRMADGAVTLAVTNRGKKFNAPEFVQPKKALSTTKDLLDGMSKARAKNVEFLKTTNVDLRNHFAENPLLGMMDTYQWFLFLNGHTERHLAQIAEIKSHKSYPAQ